MRSNNAQEAIREPRMSSRSRGRGRAEGIDKGLEGMLEGKNFGDKATLGVSDERVVAFGVLSTSMITASSVTRC